jgi:Lon protease-like protein
MQELDNLPLFPLNVVLFPYSKLPLFIFEERYKKLINENINEGKPFGIILFEDKKIYLTGCIAKVDRVISRKDNGELNIVISGIQRFHLISYETGADGYYVGKVKMKEELISEFDKEKSEKCVTIYNELVEIVYKGSINKIYLSDLKWQNNRRSISFAMAEKCGLSLLERQSLLEIESEDLRLDYILKYFEEVFPKLKEADRISNIIKSDGYIQQD